MRIVIVLWLLPMFIMIYAYTGTLTAFLTIPKLEPIVTNLKELADSSRFRLTIEESTQMADIIFVGCFFNPLLAYSRN